MTATQGSYAELLNGMHPWDFKPGDIFSYEGDTFYVDRHPTAVFVYTIRKRDKRGIKLRLESLRMDKKDIRTATEAEKAEFVAVVEEKKGDARICRGATVRIKDPKQAVKYDYEPDTIFVIVNENKRMTLIPLGGLTGKQQGLLFPASLLVYAPVVAA